MKRLGREKHSSLFGFIVNDEEFFVTLTPGANVINNFTAVINEFSLKARAFVPGKLFKPSLMFAGKAGAYLSEAPFRCSTAPL